jgi:hypothetical protein
MYFCFLCSISANLLWGSMLFLTEEISFSGTLAATFGAVAAG